MNSKQYTFSDFTKKAVINVCDGRELGHVCDLIFNNYGAILAIVVPGKKSLFKSLTSADNIVIPFNRIVKIGSDVILTDVAGGMAGTCAEQRPQQPPYPPQNAYAQPYSAGAQQFQAAAQQEFTAQAYSMPTEPMFRAEEAQNTPPQGEQPSPQTYYHTD